MSKDTFIFTSKHKKNLLIGIVAGVVITVIGILINSMGGHHGEEAAEAAHHYHWIQRVFTGLWINNVYFVGIAVIGVFFLAIQYAAMAGWSAYIKRIPEAFGYYLPVGAVLTIGLFLLTNYAASPFHIFHWLDHSLFEEGTATYDPIIAGKEGYLNLPFYLGRTIAYFGLWIAMFLLIRKHSLAEDLEGGTDNWFKMRKFSTIFIIIFAVTSSTSAWDWVMSIDTHWFSTLFGWYNFSSWFVAGLCAITLVVVWLYEQGYLPELNSSILHDLGKFIFAFSVFWAYLWISQFLLIYYANIPEETVYFVERIKSPTYAPVFYINVFINFAFPFLFLMTRDAKRNTIFLKIVAPVLLFGHWLDFYLMVTPGVLRENGGFGLIEIGLILVFASIFVYVILHGLTKSSVVARNHPMLEESLHHHI